MLLAAWGLALVSTFLVPPDREWQMCIRDRASAADIAFNLHLIRNDVYSAVDAHHNGMEADGILFLEGLTEVVAGLQTQHGSILRVDAQMGSAACMGGLALIADGLCHAAIHAQTAGEVEMCIRDSPGTARGSGSGSALRREF